jgi:hypothetical protein
MWFYVLIGLCLSLSGVAALQLMYMFYLDRLDRERKKRIHELEIERRRLATQLADARNEIAIKNDLLATAFPELQEEEVWADVLDER